MITGGHTELVRALLVSEENGYLFSGSADSTMCAWDLKVGYFIENSQNNSRLDGKFLEKLGGNVDK
jgi:WD40 repeat protein